MQHPVNTPTSSGYSPGPAWNNTPVAGGTVTANSTSRMPAGPSCQPCPACGGLDCLCRPRFFAGQLLTEQDLNRLDQYIVAKNQLHNRYLVGTGVVCGLEVTCSPCDNTVSVSAGYAIDTCGNDIIVCSPDTVDICKLIKACTPTTSTNCAPYKDARGCKDMNETWILAIRYQETPSRGMTALTGSSSCSCGGSGGSCSCGGGKSCGCGGAKTCSCGGTSMAGSCCGGQSSKSQPQVSTLTPRRGAPTTCEPTLTCEGYVYEVFKAPPAAEPVERGVTRGLAGLASDIGGEMFERIKCCLQTLVAGFAQRPTSSMEENRTLWANYCCNLRQTLIQYVLAKDGTDCRMMAQLNAIDCPSAKLDADAFRQRYTSSYEALMLIAVELMLQCICSAALPPCPAPGDPRVPLAAVTVRGSDCKVLSVCDWTPLRKHVVTTKTLGYWLGWLPVAPMLRQLMHELCCGVLGLREQLDTPVEVQTVQPAQPVQPQPKDIEAAAAADQTESGASGFDKPLTFGGGRAYSASNPLTQAVIANLAGGANPIDVDDLSRALFSPADAGSAEALTASPHAKVLAEIARPLMDSFAPLVQAVSGRKGLLQSNAVGDGGDTLAAMRVELDALRTTVNAQQNALDALRASAAATSPPAPPAQG